MSIVAAEDMNYLAQQPPEKINMILAGMTALMRDIENEASAMESQSWFQRMVKTITGKNKLKLAEIKQNHEKMSAYLSEAIAELYNRNCIDHNVMMSLGVQINELYADHIQLKRMLGAFVSRLNEKIDSIDNFHTLIAEIDHGIYSQFPPIVAVCKVMSQFDNRILEDGRKLDIISRSLSLQGILNNEQIMLTEHLAGILEISIENVGQIHLELGTIRENFMASVILRLIESYYFLPGLSRKMKNKRALIEEVIQTENLNPCVLLSINEGYGDFLHSKIDAGKERVISGARTISCISSSKQIAIIGKKNSGKTSLIEGMAALQGYGYFVTEFPDYCIYRDEGRQTEWYEIKGIDIGMENIKKAKQVIRKIAETGLSVVIYCINATSERMEDAEKDFIHYIVESHPKVKVLVVLTMNIKKDVREFVNEIEKLSKRVRVVTTLAKKYEFEIEDSETGKKRDIILHPYGLDVLSKYIF